MRVYIATTNAGKLREFREILGRSGWQVETFAGYGDVEEDETTYAGNAALKARALRDDLRRTKELARAGVLGDDSGLEVAALGGAPGVRSARFRSELPWPERRAALLADLAETPAAGRAARFVCALHYIDVAGREFAVEGEVRGRIATREAGEGGFSYDPIFEYEPDGKTFAELSESRKNSVSHRAYAVAALLRLVMRRGPAAGKTGALREAARDGT